MGSVSVVIIYGFLPLYTVLPSHDAADKIRVLCDPCIQNGTNDALSSDFVSHCIRTPVVDFPFQIFHI